MINIQGQTKGQSGGRWAGRCRGLGHQSQISVQQHIFTYNRHYRIVIEKKGDRDRQGLKRHAKGKSQNLKLYPDILATYVCQEQMQNIV